MKFTRVLAGVIALGIAALSPAHAQAGKEANWIQSVPSKGWFGIFRLYGPLEPWFDKTWRPGEIEEVK